MSTVTVVIALYNKAPYIGAAVESVLKQRYKDFKLIVVNDGSTDGSLQCMEQIKDPRLSVVSISNSGPGVARNEGLKYADTPFVTFLDADDQWHADFLWEAMTVLQNNKEVEVWLCAAEWQPLGQHRQPFLTRENHPVSGLWRLEENYTAQETYDVLNFFATGAVVAKTEVIKKYGGYFSQVRCTSGEDGYLWLQVMYNHSIYRSNQELLVVNTEGSDLGIGRKALKPIPPWLTYPEPILDHCPESYKRGLKQYLDYTAFLAFRREVYQGKILSGIKLLIKFPKLITYKPEEYPPMYWALIAYPMKWYIRKLVQYFKK